MRISPRSIKILKVLCFEKRKFHRLWLDVYNVNERAIGLCESEGFILEGLLRDNIKTENGYCSMRMYSTLGNVYYHTNQ